MLCPDKFGQTSDMGRYLKLLLFELVVIVVAVTVFATIAEKPKAGVIAGSFFVAVGVVILVWGWRDPVFRRKPTFAAGMIHLFLSALPLMLTRLANWAAVFDEVRVLGLPGPVFHDVSTGIYFALLGATAFDALRDYRAQRA